MKRPANAEKTMDRIRAWREVCPELTIRSTFIAGFPGETEEEFQTLLDFIAEAELDRVGCFAYSPVEGATANDLPGALPDEVREERRARFMEVAERVSARRLQRKVGKSLRVLVDVQAVQALQGGRFRVGQDHRRGWARPVGRGLRPGRSRPVPLR
jgi:ribosomal protein S12 methylthiotransferase